MYDVAESFKQEIFISGSLYMLRWWQLEPSMLEFELKRKIDGWNYQGLTRYSALTRMGLALSYSLL